MGPLILGNSPVSNGKERVELRRYFDELAGINGKISLEQLETMLISLGLAENPREVRFLSVPGLLYRVGQKGDRKIRSWVKSPSRSGTRHSN